MIRRSWTSTGVRRADRNHIPQLIVYYVLSLLFASTTGGLWGAA